MAEPELSTRFVWESGLIPCDLAHCPRWLRRHGQWPRSLGINLTDSHPNLVVNSVDLQSITWPLWINHRILSITWPLWTNHSILSLSHDHYELITWSSVYHMTTMNQSQDPVYHMTTMNQSQDLVFHMTTMNQSQDPQSITWPLWTNHRIPSLSHGHYEPITGSCLSHDHYELIRGSSVYHMTTMNHSQYSQPVTSEIASKLPSILHSSQYFLLCQT